MKPARDAKGRFVKRNPCRTKRPNLDAFVKNGVVHPIRKSADYDPKRAGEKPKSKAHGTMSASKTSRRVGVQDRIERLKAEFEEAKRKTASTREKLQTERRKLGEMQSQYNRLSVRDKKTTARSFFAKLSDQKRAVETAEQAYNAAVRNSESISRQLST